MKNAIKYTIIILMVIWVLTIIGINHVPTDKDYDPPQVLEVPKSPAPYPDTIIIDTIGRKKVPPFTETISVEF